MQPTLEEVVSGVKKSFLGAAIVLGLSSPSCLNNNEPSQPSVSSHASTLQSSKSPAMASWEYFTEGRNVTNRNLQGSPSTGLYRENDDAQNINSVGNYQVRSPKPSGAQTFYVGINASDDTLSFDYLVPKDFEDNVSRVYVALPKGVEILGEYQIFHQIDKSTGNQRDFFGVPFKDSDLGKKVIAFNEAVAPLTGSNPAGKDELETALDNGIALIPGKLGKVIKPATNFLKWGVQQGLDKEQADALSFAGENYYIYEMPNFEPNGNLLTSTQIGNKRKLFLDHSTIPKEASAYIFANFSARKAERGQILTAGLDDLVYEIDISGTWKSPAEKIYGEWEFFDKIDGRLGDSTPYELTISKNRITTTRNGISSSSPITWRSGHKGNPIAVLSNSDYRKYIPFGNDVIFSEPNSNKNDILVRKGVEIKIASKEEIKKDLFGKWVDAGNMSTYSNLDHRVVAGFTSIGSIGCDFGFGNQNFWSADHNFKTIFLKSSRLVKVGNTYIYSGGIVHFPRTGVREMDDQGIAMELHGDKELFFSGISLLGNTVIKSKLKRKESMQADGLEARREKQRQIIKNYRLSPEAKQKRLDEGYVFNEEVGVWFKPIKND